MIHVYRYIYIYTGRYYCLLPFLCPRLRIPEGPGGIGYVAAFGSINKLNMSSSMAVPPSPIHFHNPGDVTVENIFFPENAKLPLGSHCLVQETAKGVSNAGKLNPPPVLLSVWLAYSRTTYHELSLTCLS